MGDRLASRDDVSSRDTSVRASVGTVLQATAAAMLQRLRSTPKLKPEGRSGTGLLFLTTLVMKDLAEGVRSPSRASPQFPPLQSELPVPAHATGCCLPSAVHRTTRL